jgi:hypothetical protein
MTRRIALSLVLLAALPTLAPVAAPRTDPPAAEAAFAWPESAAGRAGRAFLAMLADGSESAIRGFESSYRTQEALEKTPMPERIRRAQGLRERFGPLTPIAVVKSATALVVVSARTADGDIVELEFAMSSQQPDKLESIGVAFEGPATTAPQQPMTDASRKELVEGVAKAVTDRYVFPDVGRKMADKIRGELASGHYASISREKEMAGQLTEDLRSVANDRHLAVRFEPADSPEGRHGPGASGDEAARDNYAFKKVELLEGNIGYLRFDLFLADPEAMKTADAALAFLRHADAIIFDLRQNGGGDPEMIRHITSYFFDSPTHLNSMMDRTGAIVDDFWTGDVPGARFPAGLPLFVLTSHSTFSGAEEFTYNLKNLHRATIIGEITGGGAHPVQPVRINDRFVVGVPFLRAVNPITKTNWEGVGVEPDVKIPADQALEKAIELARDARRGKRPGGA